MGMNASNSTYKKYYVGIYCPSKQIEQLRQKLEDKGIVLLMLPDLLDIIVRKLSNSSAGTSPEGLWLIKMLENMIWWRAIK